MARFQSFWTVGCANWMHIGTTGGYLQRVQHSVLPSSDLRLVMYACEAAKFAGSFQPATPVLLQILRDSSSKLSQPTNYISRRGIEGICSKYQVHPSWPSTGRWRLGWSHVQLVTLASYPDCADSVVHKHGHERQATQDLAYWTCVEQGRYVILQTVHQKMQLVSGQPLPSMQALSALVESQPLPLPKVDGRPMHPALF